MLTFIISYLAVFIFFILQKPISTIHISLVSPSLHRTSAPIQFTIVLGVVGTQETLCYVMTHKDRGSTVVLSISKSVEPNEEQKEMISGFQQGILCKY